jgi:hypothetical protein
MSRPRALSIALAPQLLALIVLAQPWFKVYMLVDGKNVELGSFDGATTFPSTSPIALLSLAALSVVAISAAKTRVAAVLILITANLTALILITPMILQKQISALDTELDRLTGIANTHGLSNVTVSSTGFEYVWLASLAITVAVGFWLLRLSKGWSNEDKSTSARPDRPKQSGSRVKTQSSIDLWDNQRG